MRCCCTLSPVSQISGCRLRRRVAASPTSDETAGVRRPAREAEAAQEAATLAIVRIDVWDMFLEACEAADDGCGEAQTQVVEGRCTAQSMVVQAGNLALSTRNIWREKAKTEIDVRAGKS